MQAEAEVRAILGGGALMQARQRYRQEQDRRDAAGRERRAALFGGGPVWINGR